MRRNDDNETPEEDTDVQRLPLLHDWTGIFPNLQREKERIGSAAQPKKEREEEVDDGNNGSKKRENREILQESCPIIMDISATYF